MCINILTNFNLYTIVLTSHRIDSFGFGSVVVIFC